MFGAFVVYTVYKFGIPDSYSATYYLWKDMSDTVFPIWETVTWLAGIFMCIGMSGVVEPDSMASLCCFLVPSGLLGVVIFRDFLANSVTHIEHCVMAGICAFGAGLWVALTTNLFWVLIILLLVVLNTSLMTKTFKSSICFWMEIVLFLGIPIIALIMNISML